MGEIASTCALFGCPVCGTIVFIPIDAGITGGVCTQQAKGCSGKLDRFDDNVSALVRELLTQRGIAERPWLTLVFGKPRKPQTVAS